jgi:hypothetical protein
MKGLLNKNQYFLNNFQNHRRLSEQSTVIGGFLCAVANSLKRITGKIVELASDLTEASREFIFISDRICKRFSSPGIDSWAP